eukprot:Sspe_Gene.47223::Locus_23919_Transcript_1_1_Confidence_1.000_Length_779::g.47223::m.47223
MVSTSLTRPLRALAPLHAGITRCSVQRRWTLLTPAVSALPHKMINTFTIRAPAVSSHMYITVLFSVKGTVTCVVSPCSATLWAFVTNGNGVAPRYTAITTACLLPVTRVANMAGATVAVVFVSQIFCVVTLITGVGCLTLTTVVSAWQRRAVQPRPTGYSIKTFMVTGNMVLKSLNQIVAKRANIIHRFQVGGDAQSAMMNPLLRKAF